MDQAVALAGVSRRDPLARVLTLGERSVQVGLVIGAIGALLLHSTLGVGIASQLVDLQLFAKSARERIVSNLTQTIDIQEVPEPPPPPPPPEAPPVEQKAPEPEPQAPPPDTKPQAQAAPAPAAAEAGKVLTADPDPNEPVDLSDQGFISGTGDRFAGGTTAADGKSKTAVTDRNAIGGVSPGGTGTGKAPAAPPPAKDLSRAARPASSNWNCGFPAEADMAQIDYAVVKLVVTVGPNGRPKSVSVVSDPGNGFGTLARQCALRMKYEAGLDATGQPTTKTTPPFPVRFSR